MHAAVLGLGHVPYPCGRAPARVYFSICVYHQGGQHGSEAALPSLLQIPRGSLIRFWPISDFGWNQSTKDFAIFLLLGL